MGFESTKTATPVYMKYDSKACLKSTSYMRKNDN
jgi:hypothetical protein